MSSILDSRISSDGRPLNWTTHNFKAARRARNGKTGWDILWMQNRSPSHQKFVISFVISPVASIVWVHSSVVRAADRRSAGPWLKSGCALIRTDRIATAPPPSLHSPPRPPSSRAQKYFPRSHRCDEAVRAYPLWDSNPQSLD